MRSFDTTLGARLGWRLVCKGVLVASLTQHGERSSEFRRFWWGEAVSGLGSAITSLALQTLVLVTLQGGAVQVGSTPRAGCRTWFSA